MLPVLLPAFTQNRCHVGLLPSSLAQMLRRCCWCMGRRKGLMPPSCGWLEPCGWSMPAAILQPNPCSLLGWGCWWLWTLEAAGRRAGRRCSPSWRCCQPAFVGLRWLSSWSFCTVEPELSEFIVRKTPLLLETCPLCFLIFIHYTGEECCYVNIWLSPVFSSSVALL